MRPGPDDSSGGEAMIEYQRIIIDGVEVQHGCIDTSAKFRELTNGIDLKGKRVLDVGCREGFMCYLAWQAGAGSVVGIDVDVLAIHEAEEIKARHYPDAPITFSTRRAMSVSGEYDVTIVSATLHYIPNIDAALKQISRVTKEALVLDAWVDPSPSEVPQITLASRADGSYWVPNKPALSYFLSKYFQEVHFRGKAISPDDSPREIIQCYQPTPPPIKAVLVFGESGTGKSVYAQQLVALQGYSRIELDHVFFAWFHTHGGLFNVALLAPLVRGDLRETVLLERQRIIMKGLQSAQNKDIVIEGYDMIFEDEREMIKESLRTMGWRTIEEVHLTTKWPRKTT